MTTMKDQEQAEHTKTRLGAFNERLKSMFFPGVKFSPEEEMVMKIIYKLLEAPGTIKLTPHDGPFYLVNADLHYSLSVDYNEVVIVNTVDSLSMNVAQLTGEAMRKAINESVLQDAKLIKAAMFDSKISILKRVEDRVVTATLDAKDTHQS